MPRQSVSTLRICFRMASILIEPLRSGLQVLHQVPRDSCFRDFRDWEEKMVLCVALYWMLILRSKRT